MKGVNIKEAANLIGVSAITLKRWLLSGKISEVGRNRNGWRVFTPEDITRISGFARGELASQAKHTQYKVASFFSGIGGFDLGFERSGFKSVYQNEINPFCNHILNKHWPNVPKSKDIKEVIGAEVPLSDVWVGGFPCQDVSLARMAGRDGLKGKRSGLFHEFARLLGEVRPRVVVIENVAGLLSSHGGRDFQLVIQQMAEIGYSVGWRVLNSRYFGVPQSRQRVFIVGCYRERTGPLQILFEPECREGDDPAGRQDGEEPISPFKKVFGDPGGTGPVVHGLAYCIYATSARHTGTDWSRNYVTYPQGLVRRLTPGECERVMGFPADWTVPNYEITDVEATDSERYHACGNAVTPPVIEWIAQRVRMYLERIDGITAQPHESAAIGLSQAAS